MELTIAVALCIGSAAFYAVGALVQQRVAAEPMRVLIRLPRWWLAMAGSGLGALLHVVALRFGSLTLVQALGVSTLVLAVPLAALVDRRRVGRAEAAATVLTAAGLGGLMTLISATPATALTVWQLLGLLLLTGAGLFALAGRAGRPGAGGVWSAAAGGLAFGVASAVTQTITIQLTDAGLLALIRPSGILAVLAVVGLNVAGLWFTQRSYRHGLAAPLAISTLTNPLTAAAIGLVLLGESVRTDGAGLALLLACAAAVTTGVWQLTSSGRGPTARPASAGLRHPVAA